MKKTSNMVLGLNIKQIILLPFVVLIVFMVFIFVNENIKWNKKETLICTGSEFNHNTKITYNYVDGYFKNGNIRLIVDNNLGIKEENVDWCKIFNEQYNESYIINSCRVEDEFKIVTIYSDIVSRPNVKIKLIDDRTMFENTHMKCNVE